MTDKAHRQRRTRSAGAVKQAFEDDENSHQEKTEEDPKENRVKSKKQRSAHKNGRRRKGTEKLHRKAFFTIDKTTVEVTLDEDILSWVTVLSSLNVIEPDSTTTKESTPIDSVDLKKVFGISPIYDRKTNTYSLADNRSGATATTSSNPNVSSPEGNPQLRGFQLHSTNRFEDGVLKEVLIIFQHESPSLIEEWFQLVTKILEKHRQMRDVLVVCNPYAGAGDSRNIYNYKVKSLLERAQYNIHYIEIHDQNPIENVMINFKEKFESLYGLILIGGDGSVIQLIDLFLRHLAEETQTELKRENELPHFPFPLCIVPTGSTNIISHTVHGNTDHCTPIFHLILNQRIKIDMSAVFDSDDNFITSNFAAGAGYPAHALRYFPRYNQFGLKRTILKSLNKATSKKNLKPIALQIRYNAVEQTTLSLARCYQGCLICFPNVPEVNKDQVQVFDASHIEKVNQRPKSSPLRKDSSKQSLNRWNEKEIFSKTSHGYYSQIAILTNASLWDLAPQGLSKHAHLADGLLHLILIETSSRREFIRYLKRNGNSKDQFEFPFTKLIKVREVEIELQIAGDDPRYQSLPFNPDGESSESEDFSLEESDNDEEPSRPEPHPPRTPATQSSQRHRRHHICEQTPELSSKKKANDENSFDLRNNDEFSNSREKNHSFSAKTRREKIPLPRPSSALGNETKKNKSNGKHRPGRSLLNLLGSGSLSGDKNEKSSFRMRRDSTSSKTGPADGRRSSISSRCSMTEHEKFATSTVSLSKRKKQMCMWNLDFRPFNSPLIRIKCYQRFLPVFGLGLSPDTELKKINYPCF